MTDEKGKQGFGRSAAAFGGIGVGAFLLQLQTATLGRGIRPWDDSIRLSLLRGLELAGARFWRPGIWSNFLAPKSPKAVLLSPCRRGQKKDHRRETIAMSRFAVRGMTPSSLHSRGIWNWRAHGFGGPASAFRVTFLQLQKATLSTHTIITICGTTASGLHGFGGPAAALGATFLQLQQATLGTGSHLWHDPVRRSPAWGLDLAGDRFWRPGCCIWSKFLFLQLQKATVGRGSRLSKDPVRPSLSWQLISLRIQSMDYLHAFGYARSQSVRPCYLRSDHDFCIHFRNFIF